MDLAAYVEGKKIKAEEGVWNESSLSLGAADAPPPRSLRPARTSLISIAGRLTPRPCGFIDIVVARNLWVRGKKF